VVWVSQLHNLFLKEFALLKMGGISSKVSDFWNEYGFTILVVLSISFLVYCFVTKNGIEDREPSEYDLFSLFRKIPKSKKGKKKGTGRVKSKKLGEKKCREIIQQLFGRDFPSVRPNFLKNPKTGRNLECDMINEELKLVIERNGEQHYKFTPYFHKTPQDFSDQQYRDQIKKQLLYANNYRLIIVPYTVSENNLEEYLRNEIGAYPDLVAKLVN